MFLFLITVPATGNFTEEEANIGISQDNNSVEYPLQRDEVHMTSNKGDRNHTPQSEYKKETFTFFSSSSLFILLQILCYFVFLFFDPEINNNQILLPFWPNSKKEITKVSLPQEIKNQQHVLQI